MEITTIVNLPLLIDFGWDKYMLDPLFGMKVRMEQKLIPLSNKKIRPQDVKKRRKFDALLKQYYEVYERKKAEEANNKAEREKKIKERPCFPFEGKTMQFKRMARSDCPIIL